MGTPAPIYNIPKEHPADVAVEDIEAEKITVPLDALYASLETSTTLSAVASRASSHTIEENVRFNHPVSYSDTRSYDCRDYVINSVDDDFFGNVEKYSFEDLSTDSFQLQSVTVKSGIVKRDRSREKVYCEDTSANKDSSASSYDCKCSETRPGFSISLSFSSEPDSETYEVGTTTFNFLARDRIGMWRPGRVIVNGDRNEIWNGIGFYLGTPLFRRPATDLNGAVRSIRTLLGLNE